MKNEIRQKIKCLKGQLSEDEIQQKSLAVCQRLEATEHFKKAAVVLMYWSMPDEIQTHDFIQKWYQYKTIILPVVSGDSLQLKPFRGIRLLGKNSRMELYEPTGDIYPSPQLIELAVIPGIAFDRQNNRLGRGKGYYDRLLPAINAYKIGIGFDFQLIGNVPVDQNDVALNEIITG